MEKKLKDLFSSISVTGITDDSRKVVAGNLYVAIKGKNNDGHDYISEVIKKGAKIIVGEKDPEKDWQTGKNIYVQVPNSREALSYLASFWYKNPSQKLKLIGVTGTDGKTTTANLIYWILKTAGIKAGLISTIGAKIGDKEIETGLHVTNPEPMELQKILKQMVDAGCEYAVLEVTSHGLDQGRVAGLKFEISVLTNITHEHLDYHKTYENYLETKAKLFLYSKFSILNKEDESYEKIKEILKDQEIEEYPQEIEKDLLDVIKERFPQSYNQMNSLAATTVCFKLGISKEKITEAIKNFPDIPGRLEEINNDRGIKIFIDFAHTPNALENVLTNLRKQLSGNKLFVVFGCAGERDHEKRPIMGEIAVRLADKSIFTAEDPRSENLYSILDQVAEGAEKAGAKKDEDYFLIPERQEAIAFAIETAKRGDCIVITGKGHERSLAFEKYEHPWSDKEKVKEILEADKNIGVIVLAAGAGKRMLTEYPKVLHKICGRPMISYTLENIRKAKLTNIVVVVGYKKDEVIKEVQGIVKFAEQPNVLGTADAATRGLKEIDPSLETVIVLNGDDSAFYKPETFKNLIDLQKKSNSVLIFATLEKEDPTGLGRIIRDSQGNILKIVEEKDANEEEKKIKEINIGLYVFDRKWLEENLSKIKISPQGEYYLTDLLILAISQEEKINVYKLKDENEWFGINTQEQLAKAQSLMEKKLLS